MGRIEELKQYYKLEKHPEGGCFCECYTSEASQGGRYYAGNIYFLLEKDEISHFHQIDCEEIWFYHEGCGMKITVITKEGIAEYIISNKTDSNDNVMVVIPKGAIFAAQNLDPSGYTFVSCVTTPKFSYEGFRLVYKNEIKELCPDVPEELYLLAYED